MRARKLPNLIIETFENLESYASFCDYYRRIILLYSEVKLGIVLQCTSKSDRRPGLNGAADLSIDHRPGNGVLCASELHLYLESDFERLERRLNRAVQKPLPWSLPGHDKGQHIFHGPGRPDR